MTAQVAFFTSAATVLATDSAVTVDGQKVYQGAQKVFPLSDQDPLGALIYGNTRLVGIPWATLLGLFRAQHRTAAWNEIDELASRLCAFLQHKLAHLIDAADPPYWVRRVSNLWSSIIDAAHANATPNDADSFSEQLEVTLSIEEAAWAAQDLLPSLSPEKETEIHSDVRPVVRELLRKLESGANIGSELLPAFENLKLLCFTRRAPEGSMSHASSGLVVAGFPSGALGPSYVELSFDGVGPSDIRVWPSSRESCLSPGDVGIRSFAQEDGFRTLIEGVHPWYWPLVVQRLTAAGLPRDRVLRAFQEADARWLDARTPYLHAALNSLPVPALCEIAESFVSITGLLLRIGGSLETVGGPVSVAVLSPGAPLKWMRRPADAYGY